MGPVTQIMPRFVEGDGCDSGPQLKHTNRADLFGGRLGNSLRCRYEGMEPQPHPPSAAYELLLIDADLGHLQRAVALEIVARNPVLPLTYWRRRVTRILETRHLLPAQLAVARALMDLIESSSPSERLLAKAS